MRTTYRVELDDIDFMNHVGHARWLSLCERARTGLIATEFQKLRQVGTSLVVVQADIRYRAPAFFGDVLTFDLRFEKRHSRAFTVIHEARRAQGSELCVTCKVVLAAVNASGKLVEVPEWFEKAINVQRLKAAPEASRPPV